jgi:outer membrane protein insertion porin family
MRNRLESTHWRRTGGKGRTRVLPALVGAWAVAAGLTLHGLAQAADAPGDTPQQTAAISSLSISGNSAFSSSQLQHVMGINPSGWFSRGDDYSKARLASALTSLRSFYIKRGYLRFVVREITTTPSPDGKTVAINLTVSEGPIYALSSFKLTGEAGNLAQIPGVAQALQRALPAGQPVSREGLEAARRAILAQLGHEGYTQANVWPQFATDAEKARVDLTLEVVRGRPPAQTKPVYESAVTPVAPGTEQPPATPSSATPPAVSPKAESTVPPKAEPAAPPKTASAVPPKTESATPPKAASSAPAKAESADKPPPDQQQQAGENLDLTEPREISLGASAGYSSADRVIAMLTGRYLNAFGKGRDLTADLAGGKTYRAVRLSESDRWFTQSGTSRSTSIWYHSDQPFYYLNQSGFRTSGIGLTERFDIPLTAANSVYVAPGVERDWLDLDGLAPQAYRDHVDRYGSGLNVATLRAGWTHDMRDSANLPTRGYLLQGDAELGLGNATYLKTYASARYYHPLWGKAVLSLSGLGGFGQGLGSKSYPIQKYLYAGGIGSVRGYAGNSLGSRDPGTGFPLGGRRLLAGSIEALMPLSPFRPDLPGRLVWLLFVDGGNVWSNGLGGTGAGPARFSYGTGLGWQIPFGTLKLSYARPFKRYPGDQYQKFQVEFNAGF